MPNNQSEPITNENPNTPENSEGLEELYQEASNDPLLEQEIKQLEKALPPRLSSHRGLFAGLIAVIVILVVSLGGLATVFLWPSEQSNPNELNNSEVGEKITLDDADPELVRELEEKLVYSSNSNDPSQPEGKYYSPSIDVLIEFPTDKYTPREDTRGTILNFKNTISYENFARIFLVSKNDLNNTINNYFEDYYKFKEDLEVVSSTTGEINELHLKFKQQDYLKGKKVEKQRLLLSRELDNNYLIAELLFDESVQIEEHESSLIGILESARYQPQQVDQKITLVLEKTGLKFDFDRQKWDKGYTSPISASLTFRSQDFEKEGVEFPYTSLSVSTRDTFEPVNQEYLTNYIEKILKPSTQTTYEGKNLQEAEIFQANHSNIDFSVYSYSYDGFDESRYQTYHYLGAISEKTIVEVTIKTKGEGTNGLVEARKILDSLEGPAAQAGPESSEPETQGQVLGITDNSFDTAAIIAQPAVLHIFNITCIDIRVSASQQLPNLGNNNYELCTAGLGSGFLVSADGHVITNSHVATPNELDTVFSSFHYRQLSRETNQFWDDLLSETETALTAAGKSSTFLSDQERAVYAISYFMYLREEGMIKIEASHDNYIEQDTPFNFDPGSFSLLNRSAYAGTNVVDSRGNDSLLEIAFKQSNGEEAGIETPDLALLRINTTTSEEYPVLELADPETMSIGSEISAIGFPGSADNRTLYSNEASSIATITKGNISAKKPSFNNSFDLIQIDASISQGNSGGPIVNINGEVVGVTTYNTNAGAAESSDFNAGVSVEEVISLLQDNSVDNEPGSYNKHLEQGLLDFEENYYESAKENFEKAVDLYEPAADVLNPLIKISESKIKAGTSLTKESAEVGKNSASPKTDSNPIADNMWLIVGGLGATTILAIVLIVIIMMVSNSRKRTKEKERIARLQQLYRQRQIQQSHYPPRPHYQQNFNSGQIPPNYQSY